MIPMKTTTRRFFVLTSLTMFLLGLLRVGLTQEASESLQFPRTLSNDAGTVVFHTPQIDSWADYAAVEARVAVTVTPVGEEDAVYGVAEFTADTDPNLQQRMVAV